ncbi:putative AP-2 complex subunit alpha-1 [Paratrimastix pyriformis]|uniref:AP-2 complex subunit alpha-1 n=1 Tax=Paratrimastix pyriformis TaxID=342808 RepID=A0ABQ8USV9_9EUKA|nr:putative AP-2 complex subunit alpha-1 [Paratrimastix pyriformis]
MAQSDMRGLNNFIGELRACRSKEAEERRVEKELGNIRAQFNTPSKLNSYQRKKYVCKLMYIYMIGYDVDFGHVEAMQLMASTKYSEKQIAYLCFGVLLNEKSEILRLITQPMLNDLTSRRDLFQSLALTLIANVGGAEMAETLANNVSKLLMAETSRNYIRKKAALCLLHLHRKNPEIVTPDAWVDRVMSLLNDPDGGVLTAVMSLLQGFSTSSPTLFEPAVPRVCALLEKVVIHRQVTPDYMYAHIAAPWLVVKILQFLQQYPPPESPAAQGSLRKVLDKVISTDNHFFQKKNNAMLAVLFESINLVVHLNCDADLIRKASGHLTAFISSTDSDTRYLALDCITRLCRVEQESINQSRATIIKVLHHADISLRRRALDVLFEMCNGANSEEIVGELLGYLPLAELQMREELVLKIAILAEKFPVDLQWYVDVMLKLISIGGDHMSQDVWYRVVQFVANGAEVQPYAAQTVLPYLREPHVHENCVRVASYLLGEYGHFISDKPGMGPEVQFDALARHFGSVGDHTRSLLVSAYIKFLSCFAEIAPRSSPSSLDPEIQQRACEYVAMSGHPEVMEKVWAMMPPFPPRQSLLIKQLRKRIGKLDGPDRRSRHIAEGEADEEPLSEDEPDGPLEPSPPIAGPAPAAPQPTPEADLLNVMGAATAAAPPAAAPPAAAPSVASSLMALLGAAAPAPVSAPVSAPAGPAGDILAMLGARPAQAPAPAQAPVPAAAPAPGSNDGGLIDLTSAARPTTAQLGAELASLSLSVTGNPAVDQWFRRLVVANEGVLYEDNIVQVGLKSEFRFAEGRMMLFYGNKATSPITGFSATIPPSPDLQIQYAPVPDSIPPRTQVKQILNMTCTVPFVEAPLLHLQFTNPLTNSPFSIQLRLPVVPTKFISPATPSPEEFFRAWKQIPPGSTMESNATFTPSIPVDANTVQNLGRLLNQGFHLAVLPGLDPSPSNLVCAGTFNSRTGSPVLVLLRIETFPTRQPAQISFTARTTSAPLTTAINRYLIAHFSTAGKLKPPGKKAAQPELHSTKTPTTPMEARRGSTGSFASTATSTSSLDSSGFAAARKGTVKDKYKTQLCDNWVRTQSCNYGRKCMFAHGVEDLRKSTGTPQIGVPLQGTRMHVEGPPPRLFQNTLAGLGQPGLGILPSRGTHSLRSVDSDEDEDFEASHEARFRDEESGELEGSLENYPIEEDPKELTSFYPFQSMEDRLEKVLFEYFESWEASGLGSLEHFSMPFTRLYVQLKKKSGYMIDVTKSKYKKFGRFLQEMEHRGILTVGMIRELHCVTEVKKAQLLREHARFYVREQRRVAAYQQRAALVAAPTYPSLSPGDIEHVCGYPPPPEFEGPHPTPAHTALKQLGASSEPVTAANVGYRLVFHYRAVNSEQALTEFAKSQDFGWGADVIGIWREDQGAQTRTMSFATLPFRSHDASRTTDIEVSFRSYQLQPSSVYFAMVFFEDGVTPVNGLRSYFRVYPYDGDERTAIHVILECGYRPPHYGAHFLAIAPAERREEYARSPSPAPTDGAKGAERPHFQMVPVVSVGEGFLDFHADSYNMSSVFLQLTEQNTGTSYAVYMHPSLPHNLTDASAIGLRRFFRRVFLGPQSETGPPSDIQCWRYFKRAGTSDYVCCHEPVPDGMYFVEFVGFVQHEVLVYSPISPEPRGAPGMKTADQTKPLYHAVHIQTTLDTNLKKRISAFAMAIPRSKPPAQPPPLLKLPMADTLTVHSAGPADATQPHVTAPLPPPAESDDVVHANLAPLGPLTQDQVENIKAQIVRIGRQVDKLEKQKRILDNVLFHSSNPAESILMQGGGGPNPPPSLEPEPAALPRPVSAHPSVSLVHAPPAAARPTPPIGTAPPANPPLPFGLKAAPPGLGPQQPLLAPPRDQKITAPPLLVGRELSQPPQPQPQPQPPQTQPQPPQTQPTLPFAFTPTPPISPSGWAAHQRQKQQLIAQLVAQQEQQRRILAAHLLKSPMFLQHFQQIQAQQAQAQQAQAQAQAQTQQQTQQQAYVLQQTQRALQQRLTQPPSPPALLLSPPESHPGLPLDQFLPPPEMHPLDGGEGIGVLEGVNNSSWLLSPFQGGVGESPPPAQQSQPPQAQPQSPRAPGSTQTPQPDLFATWRAANIGDQDIWRGF